MERIKVKVKDDYNSGDEPYEGYVDGYIYAPSGMMAIVIIRNRIESILLDHLEVVNNINI